MSGTQYEQKTCFGPIACHSWQDNGKKRPFLWNFDLFLTFVYRLPPHLCSKWETLGFYKQGTHTRPGDGRFYTLGSKLMTGDNPKKVNFLCRPFFGNVQMSIFFTITLCSTCWYLKMHWRRVVHESLGRLNVLVLVQPPSGSVLFFFCSNPFLDRCGYFHVRFFYSTKNMLCWLPS